MIDGLFFLGTNKMAKIIGDKREKKLKISVEEVEKTIRQLLIDFNLDIKIERFVESRLDELLNETEILANNELKNAKKYKYQFDNDLFNEIYDFILPLIKEVTERDIANSANDDNYERKIEIYDNIFQTVELTMYKTGIHKIKIVAFHYLLKVLEKKADVIMQKRKVKMIRGYKTSIEIFSHELLSIIGNNHDLEKFTLTLRSLIEQWLIKYNNRTKIGQFYYSILMINQEQVIEKILRYMMFTAIKNMNPIYLRAIFSTYVTLIHKNIFSFYALKLSNVKVGYFKQLESLFDTNLSDNVTKVQVNEMIIQNRIMSYTMKNKKYFKHNYEFLMDEYSSSFMDINYFDLLYSYDKSIPILDYFFYYSKFLKLTKNSFRSQSKLYKINAQFFKSNNKKTLKIYINDLIHERFYNYFYEIFQDKETIETICETVGNNLLKKINQHNFVTSDFNKLQLTFDDYLNQLDQIIGSMQKLMSE
jgi:hypothetical protein